MMNHLGGASKAANSDDTSSSGNAAFAVPHRWRPEPRAARGRHTKVIRISGQNLQGILPENSLDTQTNK